MDFLTAVASAKSERDAAERALWKLAETAAHVEVDGLGLDRWESEVGLTWGTGRILERIWRKWGGAVVADRPSFLDAFVAVAMPLQTRELVRR
jgi:hypothetical protein